MEEQKHEGSVFVLDQDDDEDDVLSLCNLAMGEQGADDPARSPRHVRRSTAEELFEFLTDFSFEMCPAEDIIECGKLTPFDVGNPVRRRSVSLPEAKLGSSNRLDISRSSLMRSCRSLDDNKIHHRETGSEQWQPSRMARNSSMYEKSASAVLAKDRSWSRPRWHVMMFGPVGSDARAMDWLRDIKSRQLRRTPSNLLFPSPETEADRKVTAGRGSLKAWSWKFLQLLSCQSRTSVAVSVSYSSCHKA